MKWLKVLCLVALTALTAMASIGVSSAMAEKDTALCTADQNPCEVKNLVLHTHDTSVGKVKLVTTFLTVECEVLFLGDTVEADPLIFAGEFTYSNCGSCEVKEENGPAKIEVLKEGHETLSAKGTGLIHLICGSSLNCSYSGTEVKGSGKGPLLASQKNGEIVFKEQPLSKDGGILCSKSATLTSTLTPLSATYISQSMSCLQLSPNQGLYAGADLNDATKCVGFDMGNKEWVLYPPGHS